MRKKPGPAPGDPRMVEAGRKGAKVAKEMIKTGKLPADFYSQIGKKGGSKTRERHGEDHFATIGKKGGLAAKKASGRDYYSELGKKGGAASQASRKSKKG